MSFAVAKEILLHEKIFILVSNTGRTRIIGGSANFSKRAFSGDQREGIYVFENDPKAFEWHMTEFETALDFSTNKITTEALFLNLKNADENEIDAIPIIREAKINQAGIILENNEEDDEVTEFTYNVNSLSSKYAPLIPKLEKQNGKILITPTKVKELIKNHKIANQERVARQSQYPQFKINYEDGTVYFNEKPYDFNTSKEQVKKDLIQINNYFDGYNGFIGDTKSLKNKYFLLLNYIFLSPFIARLRYEAYKTNFSIALFPLYAIITGPKSAGKSAFLDTAQTIMFGKSLGGIDNSNFTKTNVIAYLHECSGVPLHIEDIAKEKFKNNAEEIIKYEKDILRKKLINHPTFILTSNSIDTIKSDFAKRIYFSLVDATLENVDAVSKHKKAAELGKKISTSFYKEYFKRMFEKVNALIDEMQKFELNKNNETWYPDIFKLSSETIIEIYKDCDIEVPSYVSVVSYADYFGNNVIIEQIRQKINFEWEHNKNAFRILKKQNLLEYIAGERAYEAIRIKESLPEKLRAKTSGAKVIMQLDEAQKFFGITFRKGLF